MTLNIFFDRAKFEPYWQALGAFIHHFAQLEWGLCTLCHRLAGLSDDTGNALAPALRLNVSKDTINRLLDSQNRHEEKERIKRLLDHIGEINSMRNRLLHWGWANDIGLDDFVVTNVSSIHHPSRMQAHAISKDKLDCMTSDVAVAWILIQSVLLPDKVAFIPKDQMEEIWLLPWQYKPTPLDALETLAQIDPQFRARLHPSSEG